MKKLFYFLFSLTFLLPITESFSQEKRIVQVTGIVVGGDSLYGIPEVAVFVPRTGRGVLTNHIGYFSLPTLSGDTVTVRAMGFRDKKLVVPDTIDKISVVISMEMDTFLLPEIVLWPYPTFESFKKAFLAHEPAREGIDYASRNLNDKLLRQMMFDHTEASSSANHRYFTISQANRNQYRYQSPTLTLLNPFAWARFIKDIQGGGLKNRQWEEADKRKHEEEENR